MAISIDEIVLFTKEPSSLGAATFFNGRLMDVEFEGQGPRLGDAYVAQLQFSQAIEGAFAVVSKTFSVLVKDAQGKTKGQKVAVQLIKEPFGNKTWTGKLVPLEDTIAEVGLKILSGPNILDRLPRPCPRLVVTSSLLLPKFRDWGAVKDEGMLSIVEEQLHEALESRVDLRGGGTLVIEPTQALTAIDVNMGDRGRFVQSAQAIVECNQVAAQEIARQVRLRRLSGRIIVDFIAMKSPSDQRVIWETLKTSFADQKVQLIGFTKTGLFEITVKRTRRPLSEEPYFD